jgi:hypothetical protein
MSGGKHTLERKGKTSHKCTAINLEMKIRMIRNYEGGKSSFAVTLNLVLQYQL